MGAGSAARGTVVPLSAVPETAAAPRLRSDLIIRPQTTTTGTSIVVKDPTAQRFFRFGEAEYFIARQFDGHTQFDVIQRRVEDRFGRPLTEESLRRFIEKFRRFRLLDEGDVREEQHGAGRRIAGSLLYVRVKAFDPDRFLDWLTPRLGALFTPTFLVCSAVTIAIACVVLVAAWSEFTRELPRLYRFNALLLAWMTVLIATTGHELAHATTCKRFGGRVNEIGVMLIYFQPAFYCNVSDAWLIPEKWKRLWVTFAGAYFDIMMWALATIVWRLTETDTLVNFMALIIMATSGIKTMFNVNPLIKLDGYYLLSDYLEIPNLRQKSVTAVKARLRALSSLRPGALTLPDRQERLLLGYGVLATVYSTWLMTIIAWRFGAFLTSRYRGIGFIAFAGLLLMAFQRPLGNVASRIVRPMPATTPLRQWTRGPRRLLVIAVGLALLAAVPAELKVSGDFRVLPGQNAEVRTEVDGILAEIYKDEGDQVNKGETIARLDDREYASELRKVDAQISEAQARREMLIAGPRREEIALARTERDSARLRQENGEKMYENADRVRAAEIARANASVEKAAERLRFAQADLQRMRTLFASALIARQNVEFAEQDVTVRQRELEEAQAGANMAVSDDRADARKEKDLAAQELGRAEGRLRVLLAGSRPEEIKAVNAEIDSLQTQRTYLQQQVRLALVTSPLAGVIVTPKLKNRLGERVDRGDLIAKVYQQSMVTAEILVSEKEIADVRVGQSVIVKARAYPRESFASVVAAIAPAAIEDTAGVASRVIRVTTHIDNRPGLLKPEMTGTAKIYAGTRRIGDLATRRLAQFVRVEFWSWW